VGAEYPFALGLAYDNAGIDIHNTTCWGHDATEDGSFFVYYREGLITNIVGNRVTGDGTGWSANWPKREWEFKLDTDGEDFWVPVTFWEGNGTILYVAGGYSGTGVAGGYAIRKPLPHLNVTMIRHDRTSPSPKIGQDGFINFISATPPGPGNPTGTRYWTWDHKGYCSTNSAGDQAIMYGLPITYKIPLDHYFSDRPYVDGSTWAGNGWDGARDGKLAPLNLVEDQTDGMVPVDGALDQIENGYWDGDRRTGDVPGWGDPSKLSPFDIDNDGRVELPSATDPNADNAGKQTDQYGEGYDKARVLKHTITHELGHAIAVPSHSKDPECLMFEYSNNWRRDDRMSDYYRSLLRIHNKPR
jgi:hypothetical protein